MNKKILFTVPPEVQPLDLHGPTHVFLEAKELNAPVDIVTASITPNTSVKDSIGIEYANLKPYFEYTLTKNDILIIPGVGYNIIKEHNFRFKYLDFLRWLRNQNHKGVIICSICNGAFFLGEAGLLDDKFCTTHWNRADDFIERFPSAIFKKNTLFVQDENIYTSAGVSSGIDLSLHIVEKEFGSKMAVEIAKQMVIYFRRGESDPQISIYLKYRNHLDDRIHEAQSFILNNLETPFSIEDIAAHVHMSERNLSRKFKLVTGISIGNYREKLRISRAKQLLEEKHTLASVAKAVGLKSISHLKSLLNKDTI